MVFLMQYASFTLCSLLIGRLYASYCIRLTHILVVSLLLSSTALFFIGALPNFASLVVMMVIIGGAGGLVESIGTTLLSSAKGSNRMLYSSQFFYAIGAFLSPLLVGVLLDRQLGVQGIGRSIALFSLMVGIVVWLLVLQPWNRKIERQAVRNRVGPLQQAPEETLREHAAALEGPSSPSSHFSLLFITMITYVMLESSMGSWFALFMHQALHRTLAQSSFALSLYWVGLLVSRFFSILVIIRRHERVLLGHLLLIVGSLLLLLTDLHLFGDSRLPFAVFVLGLGCGPMWPLLVDFCSRIFAKRNLLMYLVGAGSIGALSGPVVTSLCFSLIGIESMLWVFLVYALVMAGNALILVFLFKKGHKSRLPLDPSSTAT